MGAIRLTAVVFLFLLGAAAGAQECSTDARLLSTKASVPNLVPGPAAFTGDALAVALEEAGNSSAVWFGLYAENLSTILEPRRIATDAADDEAITALLYTGTELGLFYRTDDVLHLQRITPSGSLIGVPVAVTPQRRPRLADEIAIVWSDVLSAYVLARHVSSGRDRGIWVTVLEEDGSERSDIEIPAVPTAAPELSVAVANDGVIGVFHLTRDEEALLYTRIRPGGFFPETRSLSPAGTNVQVVAVDDVFVVVWQKGEGPTAEIRWLIVNSADEVVRPDGLLIASNGHGVLEPRGLTATDDELALTYAIPANTATLVADLHLRRFTIAGSTLSDVPFAGDDFTAARALSSHDPIWTGNAFLTTAVRTTTSRLDSYLVRYCPLRAHIVAPALVEIGQPVTLSVLASGGVPPYTYAWTITRDPGGSRNTASVQRTFGAEGTRLLTVTVTDDTDATFTATFTLEVVAEIDEPPAKKARRRAARK